MSTYKEIESRRNRVLELITENQSITTECLSGTLDISRMTVRRDLSYLLSRGMIQRVHGGAVVRRTGENEPPYLVRTLEMLEEKKAIGAAAANLVQRNEVIIVDVGTTLLEFVRQIPKDLQAEIITNWLPIVLECATSRNARVVVLGGVANLDELSLVGSHTVETLENYIADTLFMGIGGISASLGVTDYNMEEIQVKRHMMKCAKKVIVLADHSKIDRVAPRKICDLNRIQTLICDDGITDEQRKAFERAGLATIVAQRAKPG